MNEKEQQQQRIEYIDAAGRTRTIVLPSTGKIKFGQVSVPAADVMLYLTRAGFQPRKIETA